MGFLAFPAIAARDLWGIGRIVCTIIGIGIVAILIYRGEIELLEYREDGRSPNENANVDYNPDRTASSKGWDKHLFPDLLLPCTLRDLLPQDRLIE